LAASYNFIQTLLGFDKDDAAPEDDKMRGTKVTEKPCGNEEHQKEKDGGVLGGLA